jgi:hypothetical protein
MTSPPPSCGSQKETIEVAVEVDTLVKLNQCLFGYDDGHRLLAASLRLPEEATSLLLPHSDRVPGLSAGRTDGYWTGIPVPVAKVYALMRTWPAPEMPRPGCVWTHVVLIALSDMARFPDLAVLRSLFARPSVSAGFATYASLLVVDPLKAASPVWTSISRQTGVRVLRALYAPGSRGILVDDGEPLDDAIFAAWSQQWPRLRRAFSFRTTGLTADRSSKSRFDLRVVREPISLSLLPRYVDESSQVTEWEQEAIDDLLAITPSSFRRFLWRYGSDIRRGRERYPFLAQLFLATRFPILGDAILTQTLDTIVEALPDANDGRLLKEDLLSCGRGTYSLLPAADPIDTLGYFINHTDLTALPPPPGAAFEAIHDLWPTRASEILTIAEMAANRDSAIAGQLLDDLSAVAEPTSFLALSREHPIIRGRLIRANPALLDSPDIATVPAQELSDFLTLLPDNEDLAARLVDRLLFLDNRDAAAFFADRFLGPTQDRVFDALVSELAGTGVQVSRVWSDAVRQRSPALTSYILKRATTTVGLGVLAGWLDLDVAAGLKASPTDWAAALLRVEDDIRGQPRQRLLAYLLALALARPCPGCEPLFERAFESIHTDILSSRLPSDALRALARFLPEVHWWQQWDTCLRLRLAVVGAYVKAELAPASFRRLTSDSALLKKMTDIASDTKPGRRFLQRVFDGND